LTGISGGSGSRGGGAAAGTPRTTADPRTTIDTAAVLEGFNDWLVHQDLPTNQRCRYRAHAERFLRWHADHPDVPADRLQWRLYTRLRRHGAAEGELGVVAGPAAAADHECPAMNSDRHA